MKKTLAFLAVLVLLPLIAAETINIEFPSDDNTFDPGEEIKFIVNIYDSSQQPIYNKDVSVIVEDFEKNTKKEQTIKSGEPVSISLGEKATSGQGTITASYNGVETIAFFEIGADESATFELINRELKITNIGNTRYNRKIKITIGQTEGTKQPDLEVGESVSYRLIAPDGNYMISVDDGKNPPKTWSNIRLIGTGNVIGAIADTSGQRTGITGGISPDEESDEALLSYVKRNTFVYVFILAVFGAMILLAIERRFKKRTIE